MAERVRVRNTTNYDIGLMTMNGFGYNIKPGSFIVMNRDDVEYCMSIAPRLFTPPSRLIVEDEELSQIVGISNYKEATYSDADLQKVLKGTAAKLKEFLEENRKEEHIIERICRMAKQSDLAASKIKVLQEFLPQRDFMD